MHFKLLVVFVEDSKTDDVLRAAREAGATGCTVVSNARGEGIEAPSSFFGLALTTQRDVVMLLVEEHLSRGLAIQLDVEDAVGALSQAERLVEIVEEQL